MRMTAGQQVRFGYPHAIFIAADLNFRDWNYHDVKTVIVFARAVNVGASRHATGEMTVIGSPVRSKRRYFAEGKDRRKRSGCNNGRVVGELNRAASLTIRRQIK